MVKCFNKIWFKLGQYLTIANYYIYENDTIVTFDLQIAFWPAENHSQGLEELWTGILIVFDFKFRIRLW